MIKRAKRFSYTNLSLAVITGIGLNSMAVSAQESQAQDEIEEVVATGTRLQGSAAAVLQERKEQAFVADIMGAEQIARTGDGDAASALKRVTGLTLVDGKYIYVRGLGERYSSTLLNGFTVPTPDPTRSVIPLDLFPSDIIESLSVQKAYSPSMPAAFGGGAIDIRLKTIPSDFVLKMSGSIGGNSDNISGDALSYEGGDDDWWGTDDGTREMPSILRTIFNNDLTMEDLTLDQQKDVALALNRNYDTTFESVDPNTSFNASLGDYYELADDWKAGFLATLGYSNSWSATEESKVERYSGVVLTNDQGEKIGFENGVPVIADVFGTQTEHSVKWSSLINMGLQYTNYHKIDASLLVLNDTNDRVRERVGFDSNTNTGEGEYQRKIDIVYEERRLYSSQIKGMHTIPEWNFLGVDWKYSKSRSSRNAPGGFESGYLFRDANEDLRFNRADESVNMLAGRTGAAEYLFQRLDDTVENYGYNITLPLSTDSWEYEFKVGGDWVKKAREASNRRIGFSTNQIPSQDPEALLGFQISEILTDQLITDFTSNTGQGLLQQSATPGDDYRSAQMIDAGYFQFDAFYNNEWRFSGGVRYEEFKQAIVDASARGTTSEVSPEDSSVIEDDYYPSLALTYIPNADMQYRLSYAETVVRPDLRDISNALYIDPLTEYQIQGTPGVQASNIKHYDFRWEWYLPGGDNLSVAVFYKDIQSPIETYQSETGDSAPTTRIANAETGEITGIEMEFLKSLGFLGSDYSSIWNSFFLSGNVTLSDSESVSDPAAVTELTNVNTDITNTVRRLTGHSEYVVNLQLGFDSVDGEHAATLVYNVFGERIIFPGLDGKDDAYEQPFHSLDFVYTYFPDFNSSVKLKINNILDQEKEIEFNNDVTYPVYSKSKGIGFSIGYSYEF